MQGGGARQTTGTVQSAIFPGRLKCVLQTKKKSALDEGYSTLASARLQRRAVEWETDRQFKI
jgi:hypothetical protein